MKRFDLKKQPRMWVLLAGMVVIVVVGAIVLANSLGKARTAGTVVPNSPSPSVINHGTGNSDVATPTPSPTTATSAGNGGVSTPTPAPVTPVPTPPAPTGDLLNMHTVAAGSSTKLESACQTLPGYKCSVQATNTSTGRVVAPGTTVADGNGTAIIDWNGKGLDAGTWTIRFVAANSSGSSPSNLYDTLTVTP